MNRCDLENSFTISPCNLELEEHIAPAITTEKDLHTYLTDQPTIEGIAGFLATCAYSGERDR
ncbi:MAG: hypothetical protein GZ092_18480 [Polaromonas sp.]|nr:hypothetical protein [Polaromonas sp.]